MNDDLDLRQRFEELREEERRGVPPFRTLRRSRPDRSARRWALMAVALLLLIVSLSAAVFSIRWRRVAFTSDDRMAARTIADWHPPTEFLLRTPGSELLTSMPSIPDGAARSLIQSPKGVSR